MLKKLILFIFFYLTGFNAHCGECLDDIKQLLFKTLPIQRQIKLLTDFNSEGVSLSDTRELAKHIGNSLVLTIDENKKPIIRSEKDVTKLFNEPIIKRRHGENHESMICYWCESNKKRIIKLLPRNDQTHFSSEVRNGLLAQEIGGPALHNYGIIQTIDNKLGTNVESFYIEMNFLYFGEGSLTLKEIITMDRERDAFFSIISKQVLPELAHKAAILIFTALRNKVVPVDPDLIVSSNGKIAWIDSGRWTLKSKVTDLPEEVYLELFDQIAKVDVPFANAVSVELNKIVDNSQIDKEAKDFILNYIVYPSYR